MKAAIFDADGTLLDSMHIWQKLGNRYLTQRGIPPEPGLGDILYPMSLEEGCTYLKEHYGLPESSGKIEKSMEDILTAFYRSEVQLKPGAGDYLQKLYRRGIPVLVATSGRREPLQQAFRRLGIDGYFQKILTCQELNTTKRTPDIYLEGARCLGVGPEDTAVFEDVLYGIRTAGKVGFETFAVEDDTNRQDREALREEADHYICNFKELL